MSTKIDHEFQYCIYDEDGEELATFDIKCVFTCTRDLYGQDADGNRGIWVDEIEVDWDAFLNGKSTLLPGYISEKVDIAIEETEQCTAISEAEATDRDDYESYMEDKADSDRDEAKWEAATEAETKPVDKEL